MLLITMVNGEEHKVPFTMELLDEGIDGLSYDRLLNRFTYLNPSGKRISVIYRHIVSIEEM